MNNAATLDIEEIITMLSVNFGKLAYLISIISQKLEKNTDSLTEQERELFIHERDNMRTNLDIAEDYINEAAGIIEELQKELQHGQLPKIEKSCCNWTISSSASRGKVLRKRNQMV